MRKHLYAFGALALLPLLATAPADAQSVRGDIRIGSGPVSARVVIRDDDYYRRRVVVRNPVVVVRPRVIVIDRIRDRGHEWRRNWHRQSRTVVVYYDRRGDRFYDRPWRRGLIQFEVFERGGRHYAYDDDYNYWRGRWRSDRYYDRFDRDDRDRGRGRPDRDDRDDRRGDRGDWADRYQGRSRPPN